MKDLNQKIINITNIEINQKPQPIDNNNFIIENLFFDLLRKNIQEMINQANIELDSKVIKELYENALEAHCRKYPILLRKPEIEVEVLGEKSFKIYLL